MLSDNELGRRRPRTKTGETGWAWVGSPQNSEGLLNLYELLLLFEYLYFFFFSSLLYLEYLLAVASLVLILIS